MSTVFIGGSRRLGRLNSVIRARLENIVTRGLRVVIGDANGGDRAVQTFLAERDHADVTVYCMEAGCRNNVGEWPVRVIKAAGERGFAYYTLKDAEMAREADCGFMIWDGKSKGTLVNVLRLLDSGKPIVIYFSPDRKCHTVRNKTDLTELLRRCSQANRQRLSGLLSRESKQVVLFPPTGSRPAVDQGLDLRTQRRD